MTCIFVSFLRIFYMLQILHNIMFLLYKSMQSERKKVKRKMERDKLEVWD